VLQGAAERYCGADGTWAGAPPTCLGKSMCCKVRRSASAVLTAPGQVLLQPVSVSPCTARCGGALLRC
jgi:hypothetical protein